jgi:hypothetical protein
VWLEKNDSGTVATIISEPSNAAVFIENSELGKTPYSSNNLSEDSYDVRIEYPGYESQSARIKIQKGYTVNLAVKLFPAPVPSSIKPIEGSTSIYNGSIDNAAITADTQKWVDGILYWNKTRGLNIAAAGTTQEQFFDYIFDYQGNIYNAAGKLITEQTDFEALKSAKNGLYLGNSTQEGSISTAAKEALNTLNQTVLGKTVTIKTTPTGWLRVRDLPNLNGKEIAKVDVGAKYELLEEQTGWAKIKISESLSGWVSSDYIVKN